MPYELSKIIYLSNHITI
jgi:Rad3-related DNA helicases